MLKKLARFRKNKSGVAAVEFGLIAPVMATMLLGTIEVCNALQCKQKVTSIASSVADLVAQTKSVSGTDITNIFSAANALVYPFSSTNSSIVVSSVLSDGNGNGTVAWSKAQNGTPLATNSAVVVPTGLMSASTCARGACSVILAQVSYAYSSPLGKIIVGTNNMTDYFYARPRKSATVTYSGS
ncbi:MAG TPA: TadE/TadG family type IV pilus assembly protein [Rhizomicrobium sp.]|jgi:Flp pilus assembly protein TadG